MACRLNLLAGSVVVLGMLGAGAAQATFTVVKNTSTGRISLTDTSPAYPVTELLVAANVLNGISGDPGTTLAGWSTENLSFGTDPLNCNPPSLGAVFPTAVCYKFTGPGGAPFTASSTTFAYDASFDMGNDPAEFAVLFNQPTGGQGACFGNTGSDGGCSPLAVPEPPARSLVLAGLTALLAVGGIGRVRGL